MTGGHGDEVDPAEVARLRAEVGRLQAELAPDRRGIWRPVVAGLLIAVAALLAPLAVVASWARDQVGDTDRYVETVAPLAQDPAVQAAVSARITQEIFDRLDVQALTQEAVDLLAQRGLNSTAAVGLRALATPLATGVRGFVGERVDALVRSPQFAQAWEEANREAHAQVVMVLTGDTNSSVRFDGQTVSVNLATVIEAVKDRLLDEGFGLASRIPTVQAEFTIVQSVDITRAQRAFRILEGLAVVLPAVALVCLAGAVAVGRSRRRTLVVGALAVAASMLVLGLALNVFRGIYLDVLPDVLPANAAAAIYDQLVGFIRLNLRALLVLFLAVAAIAWVTGPDAGPTTIRRTANRGVDAFRTRSDDAGLDTGRFGSVLFEYRTALRAIVLGGALLAYVLADHPTGAWTLTVLAVALVLLLVVELFARPPRNSTRPTAT